MAHSVALPEYATNVLPSSFMTVITGFEFGSFTCVWERECVCACVCVCVSVFVCVCVFVISLLCCECS